MTELGADRRVLSGTFFRERKERVRFTKQPPAPNPQPARRPAHVARMVALAHHLHAAIERGVVADRAAVARKLGMTRARITQLLDLTLLAPDIALRVLELEAVDGVEPLAERDLRRVIAAGCWAGQRGAWGAMMRAAQRTGRAEQQPAANAERCVATKHTTMRRSRFLAAERST